MPTDVNESPLPRDVEDLAGAGQRLIERGWGAGDEPLKSWTLDLVHVQVEFRRLLSH